MQATLKAHEALIQALQIRIAKLRRQKFGASSEKIEREIEQLELALEALEVVVSSTEEPSLEESEDEDGEDVTEELPTAKAPPRRRKPKVGAETPRERIVLDPGEWPGVRRCPTARGRGCERDPRADHGAVEGDRDGSAEDVLPALREDHPGAGTLPADPA